MRAHEQVGVCRDIEKAVAEDLAAVPAVSHVFTEAADATVLVWIMVDDPKPAIRYEIFDKELALMDEFPDTDFDFNIIWRMGREASDLIHGEGRAVYTR